MKRKVLTILLTLMAALGLCFALAGCDSGGKDETHVHNFTDYVYNNDGTCTKDGTETGKCSCGATDTRKKEGTSLGGHDLQFHKGVEPTCSESGTVDYYTCSRCDYQSVDRIWVPALHVKYEYYHDNGLEYQVIRLADECDHSEIVIPSTYMGAPVRGIREIDGSVFKGHTSLKKITLPDSMSGVPWGAFRDCSSLESVVIPEGVTSIGGNAFEGCSSLESIVIPESVTEIGESAFAGCSSLKTINLPAAVTEIGWYTFQGCKSLESITIPEHVITIGQMAFFGCSSLKSVVIPDSVTEIGAVAFSDCEALDSITVGKGLAKLGNYAFGESVTSIYVPDLETWCNIESGSALFGGLQQYTDPLFGTLFVGGEPVTDLVIPRSVKKIWPGAFQFCSSLTSVDFEAGSQLEAIDQSAFAYCKSLKSVELPESVTSIGQQAFEYCSSLKSVTIPEGVTSIEYGTFHQCTSLENVNIPSGVTSIGDSAFRRCLSLTSITLPESLTSIEDWAFDECDKLLEVRNNSALPIQPHSDAYGRVASAARYVYSGDGTSRQVTTEEGFVFYEDEEEAWLLAYHGNAADLTLPECSPSGKEYKIFEYAFYDCSSLRSLTIVGGVTFIGWYAFYHCTSLVSITISDCVETVGERAFNECSALEEINVSAGNPNYRSEQNCLIDKHNNTLVVGCKNSVIPASVTSIGWYAFFGCSKLENIVIPNGVTSIGQEAFEGCTSLKSIEIPDSVTKIGSYAFSTCNALKRVVIPAGVTSIEGGTFLWCDSLESVTIPEGVTSIGWEAFEYCSALKTISLPSSVTSIGEHAFLGCTLLESFSVAEGNPNYDTQDGILYNKDKSEIMIVPLGIKGSVTIPDGVTTIGDSVFFGCSQLESIVIPESVTSIGVDAFLDCASLERIVIPESVTSIGNRAFWNCTSLQQVTFAGTSRLKSIGQAAFDHCTALESIVIPDGVTEIKDETFTYCLSLKSIVIPESVVAIGSVAFRECGALAEVYYKGTPAAWQEHRSENHYDKDENGALFNATLCFYSETAPTAEMWKESSYWWHEADGEIELWTKA